MKAKLGKGILFLAGLVALQQLIALGTAGSGQIAAQVILIQDREIDPAALFYMESDLALRAEKTVRRLTGGTRP